MKQVFEMKFYYLKMLFQLHILKFDFYQYEALVLEGSFVGDTSFSAGINIGF